MAVLVETSVGEMVIDLHTDLCPLATKNFLKLAKSVALAPSPCQPKAPPLPPALLASPLTYLHRSMTREMDEVPRILCYGSCNLPPAPALATIPPEPLLSRRGMPMPILFPPPRMKYYHHCVFHRVQRDFIVQTGDPTATGAGGDSVYKCVGGHGVFLYGEQARFFEDEIRAGLKHDKVGVVAMASGDSNLNASQVTLNASQVTLNASQVTLNASQVTLNASQVTLNASQVTLNASQVTLIASQVTLNASQPRFPHAGPAHRISEISSRLIMIHSCIFHALLSHPPSALRPLFSLPFWRPLLASPTAQFYITTRAGLDSLDGKHTIFGEVAEGLDTLQRINEAFVDDKGRPFKNIRYAPSRTSGTPLQEHPVPNCRLSPASSPTSIRRVHVLDDPFDDPPGLADLIPDASPPMPPPAAVSPPFLRLPPLPPGVGEDVRLEDDWVPMDEGRAADEVERDVRRREAQSRGVVLEMVRAVESGAEMIGDLPEAEFKPPENVLFICKLNPVTQDDDLEIIFSRFGKVLSADIIRDQKTGDSLCYGFIEFETKEACEAAYFK
ncbi:unnamed protein product, partial [Closterium sp. NIES-65]